jgi:hypothetical protein
MVWGEHPASVPMTTKLAAFFRLFLLYSASTSIFLLLILGTSWTESSRIPFASGSFDLVGSFGFTMVDGAAAKTAELADI